MLKIKKGKIKGFKDYFIGFIIGISFISGVSYASTGSIGGLFEKISGNWKLVGTNIKDGTVGVNQLGTDSVTTAKIVDKNVTEEKLSDDILIKLNSPIVTETDPLSVKLTGNQTIGGTKTFTNQVFGVNPTLNNHLVTKEAVDNAINAVLSTLFTYSWNIGSYGACSVSCGGGTQSRSVTCRRDDGVTVSDSFCTGIKPVTSRSCNTGACVVAVNGTCGSSNGTTRSTAPTTNLCSTGIASSVSSIPWTWTCYGTGGGANMNCSANCYNPGTWSDWTEYSTLYTCANFLASPTACIPRNGVDICGTSYITYQKACYTWPSGAITVTCGRTTP